MQYLSLLLILIITAPYILHADEEWQLKLEENDIQVFNRPLTDSDFREVKGTTRIKESLSTVVALLNDVDNNEKWVPRSGGATIIEAVSEVENYVRGILYAPWPFRDRDCIVHFHLVQDENTNRVTIKMTGVPDYRPEERNYVRIPRLNGAWILEPEENGYIKIIYRIHTDPGGNVPAWIVNAFTARTVYRTILNMKLLLKHEKYQRARFDFIREP